MAYNLLGQQGPKGQRNPDPNLTAEVATYLYDTPPGSGDNKGLDNKGKPVDKKDVAEKLENVTAGEGPPPSDEGPPPSPALSSEKIKEIQKILKDFFDYTRDDRFNPGPIDGIVGPLTISAAKAYVEDARETVSISNDVTTLTKRIDEVGSILDDADKVIPEPEEGDEEPEEGDEELSVRDRLKNMGLSAEREEDLLKLAEEEWTQDQWDSKYGKNSLTIKEILFVIDYKPRPSTPADATSYEVDKLNAELGITNTALGSSIKRGWERVMYGDMDYNSFIQLVEDVEKARSEYKSGDKSFAQRAGAFLRTVAMQGGFVTRGTGALFEEILGGLFNAGTDLIRPEGGGAGDAFADALLGVDQGTNSWSKWWEEKKPGWRYNAFENEFYDITTGEKISQEEVAAAASQAVQSPGTAQGTGTGQGTGQSAPPPDEAYNAIGQLGPRGQSNEGYEYKFDDPPGQGLNPGVTKIGDPDPDPKVQVVGEPFREIYITIYKDGAEKQILQSDWSMFESQGWTRIKPGPDVSTTLTTETPEETTEQEEGDAGELYDFNNIPEGAYLWNVDGTNYVVYEVPGSNGELYEGNPIFMAYEVQENDVVKAGIYSPEGPAITGAPVSKVFFDKIAIVTGNTDQLSADIDNPFASFVETIGEQALVAPWIKDPEMLSLIAEAAVEGRVVTDAEWQVTNWYQEHNETEREWLRTYYSDPSTAAQLTTDAQLSVANSLQASGVSNAPEALVNWVAGKYISGEWSDTYTAEQIALFADPYAAGKRDAQFETYLSSTAITGVDRTTAREREVEELFATWLGPTLGKLTDQEKAEIAGKLRDDPDYKDTLIGSLKQSRLAAFSNYTNPELTYDDIARPWRNLTTSVWGQTADETQGWWQEMVKSNDFATAQTTLREKGLENNITQVTQDATQALTQALGEGLATQGVNQ